MAVSTRKWHVSVENLPKIFCGCASSFPYLFTLFVVLSWLTSFMLVTKTSVEAVGGWGTDDKHILKDSGPCNIDVRHSDSLSESEFLERYAFERPVVIQLGSERNSQFQQRCEKKTLLAEFGDKIVRLSTANTHSYQKRDVTLRKYVESIMRPQSLGMLGNETLYYFGDNNYTEWEDIFKLYTPPPYTLPQTEVALSFGIAGAGTGVPLHFHGPAFAEVIYGRKRWFLYPPHHDPKFDPDKTTLRWLHDDYPNLTGENLPWECTISQNEVIYFPDHWWHGTLNLETSVFISTFLG